MDDEFCAYCFALLDLVDHFDGSICCSEECEHLLALKEAPGDK